MGQVPVTGSCGGCGSPEGRRFRFPSASSSGAEGFLCASCARKAGLFSGQAYRVPGGRELAAAMLGMGRYDELICHGCGSSWYGVRLSGRLGCPACHDVFRQAIREILVLHSPVDPEVPALREQLALVLAQENFEEAAIIRDRIRALGGGT